MSYGFVYILGNEYMPDLIKIGCTERSPSARADELSKPTGVPAPFQVLCYAEFYDFQTIERGMHEWCKQHRVNSQREFFAGCIPWAVSLLYFHPSRLAFVDATEKADDHGGFSHLHSLVCEQHQHGIGDLRNPWKDKAEEAVRQEQLKRYHAGDFRRLDASGNLVYDPDDDMPFDPVADKAANETPASLVVDRLPWETDETPATSQEASA